MLKSLPTPLRVVLSVFLSMITIFFLVLAIIYNPSASSNLITQTIENNHKIEEKFKSAAKQVDGFKAKFSRLPTQEEFNDIIRSPGTEITTAEKTWQYPKDHDFFKLSERGEAPAGSYVLSYWRGEWTEYYTSWDNKMSLSFNKSDYYIFDTALGDSIFFIALFILSLFLTIGTTFLMFRSRKIQAHG